MPYCWTPEALLRERRHHKPRQNNHILAFSKPYTYIYRYTIKTQSHQYSDPIMQPYAKEAQTAKSGLEKVKQPFLQNRRDLKKAP